MITRQYNRAAGFPAWAAQAGNGYSTESSQWSIPTPPAREDRNSPARRCPRSAAPRIRISRPPACGDEPDTYWETFVLNVVSRKRGDGPI